MFAPLQLLLVLALWALASDARLTKHRAPMRLGDKLKGIGDRVQAELGLGAGGSGGGAQHGQQQQWQPPPQQWQQPQQHMQQTWAPHNPIRHGKVHAG